MAYITETPNFDTNIYQIASNDPVQGGTDSDIANLQAVSLANRTQWLKAQIETILSNQATDEANIAANTAAISTINTRLTADEANIASNTAAIAALVPAVIMPGDIIITGGSAVRSGFLGCNGAAVSRTTYAALFAAIGIAYGSGDGVTTFNIPDGRGEFLRGWDSIGGSGAGVDPGRALGSKQADCFQDHDHTFTSEIGTTGGSGTTAGNNFATAPRTITTSGAANGRPNSTSPSGTQGETRPVNVAVMYQIKY